MTSQLFSVPKRPPNYINNQPRTLTSPSPQSSPTINVFSKALLPRENTSLDNNRIVPSSVSNVSKTLELSFSRTASPNKNGITLATPLKAAEVNTPNPIVLPQTNLITNQSNQGIFSQPNNQVFNTQTGQVFQNATQNFSNVLQNSNQQMWGNGAQKTTFFTQTNNQIGVNLGTLGVQASQPFITNNNTNFFQPQLQPDPYNTNAQLNQFPPAFPLNTQHPQSPYDQQCPSYPQNSNQIQFSQDNGMLPFIMYPLEEDQRSEAYNQIIACLEQQVTGYQEFFKALALFALFENCNDWELRHFHPNQLLELVGKFALMTDLQAKRRREIEEYRNSIEGMIDIDRLGYFRFDERNNGSYYDEYIQSTLESILKGQRELCKIILTNPALTKQIIDNRSNINKYLSSKITMNANEFHYSPLEPAKRHRSEDPKMSQLDFATGEQDIWGEREHEEHNPSDIWRACAAKKTTFGADWIIEVEEIDEEQRFRELMARY